MSFSEKVTQTNTEETIEIEPVVSSERSEEIRVIVDSYMEGGILMPDKEAFDAILPLQVEIYPQRDEDGDITYLLGKGVGVELALQGEVSGVQRAEIDAKDIPVRSHSDFELYGIHLSRFDRGIYYPTGYVDVFAAQEAYTTTKTKGLERIPEELMHMTAATVVYNGQEYLIPRLEILWLDKFLKTNPNEGEFRFEDLTELEDGTDAFLLARKYDLDRAALHRMLEEFRLKVDKEKLSEDWLDNKVALAEKKLGNMLKSNYGGNIEDFEKFLRRPEGFDAMVLDQVYPFTASLTRDDFNPDGTFTDVGRKKVTNQFEEMRKKRLLELDEEHKRLDEFLDRATQTRQTTD